MALPDTREGNKVISEAVFAEQRAHSLLEEASALSVESAEDLAIAAEMRESIRKAEKESEADRERLKRPILEEGRHIDGAFGTSKNILAQALGIVDRCIRQYRAIEEQKRKAAELEVRRIAEIERQKLLKQAQRAENKGLTETADRLERAAEAVPLPAVAPMPKVEGLIAKKVWRFEVVDKAALLMAAATNPAFAGLAQVDEAALRRMVIALRTGNPVPGVRAWEDEEFSSTRTVR